MSKKTNKDLWPSELTQETVISPITLLKEQAELLSEKTGEYLIGEVVSLDTEATGMRKYGFGIKAPGLKNYMFPLFVITYDVHAVFPMNLASRQIKDEKHPRSQRVAADELRRFRDDFGSNFI